MLLSTMQRNASRRRDAIEVVQQLPAARDVVTMRAALNVTTCVFAPAVTLATAGTAARSIAVAAATKADVLMRERSSTQASISSLSYAGVMNESIVIKRFDRPDRIETFEKGTFEVIQLGGMVLGRASYEPGWKWSEHLGPRVGSKLCSTEHVGIVVSGCAAVMDANGKVVEMRAGDAFHITGEHDSWVIGDVPYVSLHLMGAGEYV